MAFIDEHSASGYLFPNKILQDAGVKPSAVSFVGKHDEVVRQVYLGQVDAGATFYSAPDNHGNIRDARSRVLDEFPDVEDKVKIIKVTDPIPNDPVVFSKDLPHDVQYQLSLGLIILMSTESVKEVLKELYSIEGICTLL